MGKELGTVGLASNTNYLIYTYISYDLYFYNKYAIELISTKKSKSCIDGLVNS